MEGFDVPRNSMALTNLYWFMRDPNYWENPNDFAPDRFLETVDGEQKLVRREMFVPYGLGKRSCMGEALAKDTLLIFFTNLVKSLKFSPPSYHPFPDPNNYTAGFTIIPKAFHVNIECRN